jgi:hypothetical protein
MHHPIVILVIALLGTCTSGFCDVYLEAGCAATDREWRAQEHAALIALIEAKKVPLPVLSDVDGAKVLRRVCSVDNLSFGRNKSLPFGARMEDFLGLMPAVNSLSKKMVAEALAGKQVSTESSMLMCQTLHIAALGIELMDEFLPTLKRDETYEIRMQGAQKMKSGMATVLAGAYTSVAEDTLYSPSERSTMLVAMAETADRFASVLSTDQKTEMQLKFMRLREKLTENMDRESIDRVVNAMKR